MPSKNRLRASALAVAALTAASLVACSSSNEPGETEDGTRPVEVRFKWWGSDTRHQLYTHAIEAFEEDHPNIRIVPEFSGFDGYWDSFNTQAAGGNTPDVIQMTTSQIGTQSEAGSIVPLDAYIGPSLELTDWSDSVLDTGRIGSDLYGINIGSTVHVWMINAALLDELGIDLPSAAYPDVQPWPTHDFVDFAREVSAKGDGVYGTVDNGGMFQPFEAWLVGRGKSWFNAEGALNFTEADLREWWTFWDELRTEGVATPADLTAMEDESAENSAVVAGRAASGFAWSGNYAGWHEASGGDLLPAPVPGDSRTFFKVSIYLSLTPNGSAKPEALTFLNWLATSTEAARILGVERGLPPHEETQEAAAENLEGAQREIIDFISELNASGLIEPTPALYPPGSAELLEQDFRRIYEQIAFDTITVDEGVDRLFQAHRDLLG